MAIRVRVSVLTCAGRGAEGAYDNGQEGEMGLLSCWGKKVTLGRI